MQRTIVTLGLLMLLAIPVGVAAQPAPIRCGPNAGPTPAPQCYSGRTAIEIVNPGDGVHFMPPGTFVQAGTTITWTNSDYEEHTVTADDGSFASGPLGPGQQFSHTFGFAGGFGYHCDFHPNPSTSVSLIPRVIVTT
jgi:plastocyanin